VHKERRRDFRGWIELVSDLPRSTKRAIMVAADVVMIPLALYTAITLRLGTTDHHIGGGAWLYVAVAVASVPVFAKLGLYRAVVRYLGGKALIAVISGVTLSVGLLLLLNLTVTHKEVPTGAFAIYWALALLYVGGSRYLVRLTLQASNAAGERVVIYGAGEAGVRLAMALQGGKDFKPVAFVDDSRALRGSVMNGIEVFDPADLTKIISEYSATRVFLAVPSETRRRRREILTRLESVGIHVQTIPDLSDIASGRARVDEIHEVDVSDLLGRDAVPPNQTLLSACIHGKSVLVTGAGGSPWQGGRIHAAPLAVPIDNGAPSPHAAPERPFPRTGAPGEGGIRWTSRPSRPARTARTSSREPSDWSTPRARSSP